MTQTTKRWMIGGSAVLMLAIAGFIAWMNADSVAAAIEEPVTAFRDEDGDVNRRGPRGDRGGFGGEVDRDALMADALGISVEDFEAAQEAARAAAIADAVEAGDLTEEEAEAILSGEARGPRGLRGQRGEGDVYLADALGITLEELEAAKEDASAAGLAQLVEDGVITQEEADLFEAGQALKEYVDKQAIMADVLGLTVEELEAAKEDGTSKSELIEAAGLDRDSFGEAVDAAVSDAVDQAVADGIVTQEQADQLMEMGQRGPRGERGPRGDGPRGQRGGGEFTPPTDTVDA